MIPKIPKKLLWAMFALTVSPLLIVVVVFYSFHGIKLIFSLPETIKLRDFMIGVLLIWGLIDGVLIWIFATLFTKTVSDEIQMGQLELSATSEQLKAAEEYIAYTEKKYEILVKNMNDVVWMATPDGKVTYINESCERILGFTPDEIIGQELFALMCPLHDYNGSNCEDIVSQMAFENYEAQELWMLHSDGKTRKIIEVSTRRVIQEGRIIEIQGVGRDVTERVYAQRQNQKKQEQLQVLSQISYTIVSEFDSANMNKLFEDVCELLVHTMDYPLATLRAIKGMHLQTIAVSGEMKHKIGRNDIVLNEEQYQRIFNTKHAHAHLLSDQMAKSPFYDTFYENQIQHVLSIPMFVEGKPFSVLSVFSKNSFDTAAYSLLEAIGYQLTLAMEKSGHIEGMRVMYLKIIDSLVTTIEAKDLYTEGHSRRVSEYAVAIAKQLRLADDLVADIEIAGLLHDIGKIGIADAILTKGGQLTPEEFEEIQKHPVISQKILEPIGLSNRVLEGVLYHHARYDLKGYPKDHQLQQLPQIACIVGVADAFDAMTSNRAYKKTITIDEVKQELQNNCETQFCRVTVEALLKWLQEHEGTA